MIPLFCASYFSRIFLLIVLAIFLSSCRLRSVDRYSGLEVSPCILSIIMGRADCSNFVDPEICSCERFLSGDPICFESFEESGLDELVNDELPPVHQGSKRNRGNIVGG